MQPAPGVAIAVLQQKGIMIMQCSQKNRGTTEYVQYYKPPTSDVSRNTSDTLADIAAVEARYVIRVDITYYQLCDDKELVVDIDSVIERFKKDLNKWLKKQGLADEIVLEKEDAFAGVIYVCCTRELAEKLVSMAGVGTVGPTDR